MDSVAVFDGDRPGAMLSVDEGVTRGDARVRVGEAVELIDIVLVVDVVIVGRGEGDSVPVFGGDEAAVGDTDGVPVAAAL